MTDTHHVRGTVWAVFGHRLAIEGADGRTLADLGPKGAEGVSLAVGDRVSVEGEHKPTEIKVTSITVGDGAARAIAWPKPHEHGDADPAAALATVKAEGYAIEGEPTRRPKHFEIMGSKDGSTHELHVTLDGTIRKVKPAKG
ncbi:hypothetical protein [Methylobacterium aerolatum]|uniref:Uncharacterized protein n=1 Tax=Methylobacterium aerolatum TaxID=418708 RepID=A0ABU0HX14_9HYPH|nr:hypothetical protein [Methylobacterium aerolatum]MDQ0446024.1 hypothetical protein [Methylobacterium aerolatum]GJD35061.1 hypothetical protein FMGBMHLM_1968 [Methylobacterium aerolatum]